MSEYGPHRRLEDGRWVYMVITAQGPRSIGYCAHGCPGHNSPEEAVAHFQEYQIDHAQFVHVEDAFIQHRCEYPVCPEFTASYAQTEDGRSHMLCSNHLDREGLTEVIDPPVGHD